MNRLRATLSLAFALVIALPASAHAGGIPLLSGDWTIVPKLCHTCACGFAGALTTIQNGMNATISLGIVIFVAFIVYAGVLFIMTPFNPESRSTARKMLLNAIIGFIIVIAAWLIVDFVMKTLYNPNTVGFGPWNSILIGGDMCIEAREGVKITGLPGVINTQVEGGGIETSGGSGGGGSCEVHSSGPCSAANFVAAFGADKANEASEICSAESCNGTCFQGDKIVGGADNGKPVSFGLFQINITAHDFPGLPCSQKGKVFDSQFTGSHKDVKIVNPALYEQCKAAALDSAKNIAVAASIYKTDPHKGSNAGSWWQWSTREGCGLSSLGSSKLAALACPLFE